MPAKTGIRATIASLHVHGTSSRTAMVAVEELNLVVNRGIREDRRYFDRPSRSNGRPSRRQVTLVDRETIAEHAASLGLPSLPPGIVKSNIETLGARLVDWLGQEVVVGTAVVRFYGPRTPCEQMDAICRGLRARMENNRQGVLAEILQSGVVRVGDEIRPHSDRAAVVPE